MLHDDAPLQNQVVSLEESMLSNVTRKAVSLITVEFAGVETKSQMQDQVLLQIKQIILRQLFHYMNNKISTNILQMISKQISNSNQLDIKSWTQYVKVVEKWKIRMKLNRYKVKQTELKWTDLLIQRQCYKTGKGG